MTPQQMLKLQPSIFGEGTMVCEDGPCGPSGSAGRWCGSEDNVFGSEDDSWCCTGHVRAERVRLGHHCFSGFAMPVFGSEFLVFGSERFVVELSESFVVLLGSVCGSDPAFFGSGRTLLVAVLPLLGSPNAVRIRRIVVRIRQLAS